MRPVIALNGDYQLFPHRLARGKGIFRNFFVVFQQAADVAGDGVPGLSRASDGVRP